MTKMRDLIRMTDSEIAAFLARCRNLQVATLDAGGAPHLTTVWFAFVDGAFLFETYGKSQKVVNLRRDPRIALLCEAGDSYDALRGVSVQGRAEIVDGGERLLALMKAIVARNHRGMSDGEVETIARSMIEKRVVVSVRPHRVMSWDHGKLPIG